MPFGSEKLEWCGYSMVKKCWCYVYSFWQNSWTWRTHTHTDKAWRHRPHLCIASCGKNEKVIRNPHTDPDQYQKLTGSKGSLLAHACQVWSMSVSAFTSCPVWQTERSHNNVNQITLFTSSSEMWTSDEDADSLCGLRDWQGSESHSRLTSERQHHRMCITQLIINYF